MYIDNCLAVGLLVTVNIILCSSFSVLGRANIIIERLEQCDDAEKYPIENNMIMKKINRTTAGITGCLRAPEDLGPTSSLKVHLSKWGDGGWKPNAYNVDLQDVCQSFRKYINTALEEMLEFNGIKNEGCPLKKRDYCLENFVVSMGKMFPSVLYGKFRADAVILIDSKPIFCLRAFIVSTPNVSG